MRRVILLAEDDPDDALIFQIAFRRAVLPYDIYVVRDGQQVIEYLIGSEKYFDRQRFPFPDVLVLDLKMPIKNGFEVLEWLRQHPEFHQIQVVIVSSSDEVSSIRKAADLGAATYFIKSSALQDVTQHFRVT